jgi:hypothetical protein
MNDHQQLGGQAEARDLKEREGEAPNKQRQQQERHEYRMQRWCEAQIVDITVD